MKSFPFIHPIKRLLHAWRRLRLSRREKRPGGPEVHARRSHTQKGHRRHGAFLELP